MNNQLKSLLWVGAFLVSQTPLLYAERIEPEDKNPLGCKDVGYQYTLQTLDIFPAAVGEKQSLYFVFNALSQPVNLYQMREKDSPEAISLNHTIPPKQWAALSIDANKIKFACTVDDKKHTYGRIIDCANSLKVCEFARVKYGLNNRGNFWMVKGSGKNDAVRAVNYYGVIAR